MSKFSKIRFGDGLAVTDEGGGVITVSASGGGGGGGRTVLGYTEFTSNISISSTAESFPTTIVTAPSVTLDGTTRVAVTFYAPQHSAGTGASGLLINLWQDTTALGWMATASVSGAGLAVMATRFLTPAAGSYVFSIRGWYTGSSSGLIQAGTGAAGHQMPGYILIEEVAGGGIQFDTDPQTGGWLLVNANGTHPGSGVGAPAERGIEMYANAGGLEMWGTDVLIGASERDHEVNAYQKVLITSITGDIELSAGGHVILGVPTADPHVVGALWNSAGTLKISAG